MPVILLGLRQRLLISFSGGRSSAMMTKLMLDDDLFYDEVLIVFANTGQERNETLDFVKQCDEVFGFNTVWVEAVTHHGTRKGCTHAITSHHDANRDGRVFEDVISKYGLPNVNYPHCNRELKLNPIRSYLRSIGWKHGSYDTAIGIRADEMDRVTIDYRKKGYHLPSLIQGCYERICQRLVVKPAFQS